MKYMDALVCFMLWGESRKGMLLLTGTDLIGIKHQ